jgi:hypothetical protein
MYIKIHIASSPSNKDVHSILVLHLVRGESFRKFQTQAPLVVCKCKCMSTHVRILLSEYIPFEAALIETQQMIDLRRWRHAISLDLHLGKQGCMLEQFPLFFLLREMFLHYLFFPIVHAHIYTCVYRPECIRPKGRTTSSIHTGYALRGKKHIFSITTWWRHSSSRTCVQDT